MVRTIVMCTTVVYNSVFSSPTFTVRLGGGSLGMFLMNNNKLVFEKN